MLAANSGTIHYSRFDGVSKTSFRLSFLSPGQGQLVATELSGNCTLSALYAGAQVSTLCEPQAVNLVGTPEELGVSNTQWEDWHLLLDLVT